MSGEKYQNFAKLSIRHYFVTFLLLCVLRTICSVQPCQGREFKNKSLTLWWRGCGHVYTRCGGEELYDWGGFYCLG